MALYFLTSGCRRKDRLEEREKLDRVPYPLWARQGLLEAPAGRAQSSAESPKSRLNSTCKALPSTDGDWKTYRKLMQDEGIEIPITPWGQGFKDMGPAVDALEAAILDRS